MRSYIRAHTIHILFQCRRRIKYNRDGGGIEDSTHLYHVVYNVYILNAVSVVSVNFSGAFFGFHYITFGCIVLGDCVEENVHGSAQVRSCTYMCISAQKYRERTIASHTYTYI